MLAPHKRPFHTIIPAFMEHGDQHIGFGIMGGPNQPLAHAQFVSNIVDYRMNIEAALENARFTVNDKRGCNIVIESRVKPEVRDQLNPWDTSFRWIANTPPTWDAVRLFCTIEDEGELRRFRRPRRRLRRA